MATTKLTASQKAIIDNLKKEFLALNKEEVVTGGIINVQSIIRQSKEEKDFKEQCALENRAYHKIVVEQMTADAKSLTKDLDALGLKWIARSNERNVAFLYIVDKKATYDTMHSGDFYPIKLEYETSHYQDKKCHSKEERIHSGVRIKIEDSIFKDFFSDIEGAMNSKRLTERIKWAYERANGIN